MTQKLYVLSDLHNERLKFQIPEDIEYDVLVAAGDIDDNPERSIEFLAGVGKPCVMVCGNHCLWSDVKRGRLHVDFSRRIGDLKKLCEGTQVHLLEQESLVIGDTRFLGTMLWTSYMNGNKQLMCYALSSMNDYGSIGAQEWLRDPERREQFLKDCEHYGFERDTADRIDWDTVRFHPVLAYRWHEESINWLRQELREEGDWKRTVVVTHHSPTYLSLTSTGFVKEKNLDPKRWSPRLDMRWDDDNIYRIGGYASPDDHFLAQHHDKIDLWVHGHVHASVAVAAGGVAVVSNPRGYAFFKEAVQSGDNHDFNPRLVIDLDAQGGYMPLLKAEIDESVVKLEDILDEIKGFGAHRKHKDPSLRVAAREAFEKRIEAFGVEGRRIGKRVNENLQSNMSPNDTNLDFPLKAFCASPNLSTSTFLSRTSHHVDRALSSIVKDAKRFIGVLNRIPALPGLMAKEAGKNGKLVVDALAKEGVKAEYLPVDDQHVDVELYFRVDGRYEEARQNELSQIADETINRKMSRQWYVHFKFEQPEDEDQTEEAEEAATGARTSVEALVVSPERQFALTFPVVTFAHPVEVFYQLEPKWKVLTIRMEEAYSTSAVFSHPLLVQAVLQIEKEHEIKIVLDDTGQGYRLHGPDDPHYRIEFVMGKVKYRTNIIRQLPIEEGGVRDVVVELEPG